MDDLTLQAISKHVSEYGPAWVGAIGNVIIAIKQKNINIKFWDITLAYLVAGIVGTSILVLTLSILEISGTFDDRPRTIFAAGILGGVGGWPLYMWCKGKVEKYLDKFITAIITWKLGKQAGDSAKNVKNQSPIPPPYYPDETDPYRNENRYQDESDPIMDDDYIRK